MLTPGTTGGPGGVGGGGGNFLSGLIDFAGTPGGGTFLSGGVSSGLELIGGLLDQFLFQPQERRAMGRQAAQMDPFIDALMTLGEDIGSGGNYGGLRGAASRELAGGMNALRAGMAQRGIYDSGAAMQAESQFSGDVISNLAQAINADQLARAQAQGALTSQALSAIQSTPGYAYFDRDTGKTRGK